MIVFGTTLARCHDLGDSLELALCVVREQPPRMTVAVTIDVACWCEPDHGTHTVRSAEWLGGNPTALTDAFESAADTLVGWAAASPDPKIHRAAAGLPNPKSV